MAVKPTIILTRLAAQARFMRRRCLAGLVLGALLAGALPLLLVSLADRFWVLREPAAGAWFVGCLLAGLAALAGGYLWLRRRLPGVRQVASALEEDHPEYMDSLVTAVELLQQPVERLNPLNHALLVDVTRRLLGQDVEAAIRRRVIGAGRLALLAAAGGAVLALCAAMPLCRKAAWFWHDFATGTPSGLIVTPGHHELPAGDDVTIAARINRGPQQAQIRLWTERGPIVYDLYAAGENSHSIDLYGIDADFSYQVFTPTLRSPRYRVSTFRRPEIESISIAIEPPAYTGLARTVTDQLVDLAAPRDSAISVRLRANMPVAATLVPESGAPVPLADAGGQAYEGRFTLDRTLRYRLHLDDLRGHLVPTDAAYTIECIEDTPPVVQFVAPDEDADRTPSETVEFELGAFDNYGLGLVQLHYSINGGSFQAVELYRSPADDRQTELTPRHALELEGKVVPGDVIYYYASAADNHLPAPLESRTEIRFLEIRPDKPKLEEMDKMQGGGEGGGPSLNLDISDLILAQKHLIRQTFRLEESPDSPTRRQSVEELAIGAADQLLNASKRYEDIKQKAGGRSLGIVDKLFPEALTQLNNANTLLKGGAVAESLPFQQRTLSKLIAIEIELLKNAKPQQGQGAGEPSPGPPPPKSASEDSQDKQQQEKIEGLQKLVDKLKDLAQRQRSLNQGLARHREGERLESQFRAQAAPEQQGILGSTFDVRNELQQVPEAFEIVKELTKATHHMTNTRQGIQLSRADQATKEGTLAEQFLVRGHELLDKLVGDLSGNQLLVASRLLENLRQRQQELREKTTQAAAKPTDSQAGLTGQQKGIRDDLTGLLEDMGRAAASLEEQNPQSARSLADALDSARQTNLDGTMKRAENALAYKRNQKAAEYQQQAEGDLARLARQLREAAEQTGGPSKAELTRLLRQTLGDLEAMQKLAEENADAEAKRAQADKMKDHLKEMAGQVGDKRLQELQQAASSIGASSTAFGPEEVQQMMAVMMQTARILENKITELDVAQRVIFARMTGREPPDEYRKLVNEYFKNLSEQE